MPAVSDMIQWQTSKRPGCGDTNAVTSSVASRPTMCAIALSPPGWYFSQPSTFNACWSTIITERPSAINASTSLRESSGYTFVFPFPCFCWGAEGAISTEGIESRFRRLCRRPIETELGNWFTEASGGEGRGYVGGTGPGELLTASLSEGLGVCGTTRALPRDATTRRAYVPSVGSQRIREEEEAYPGPRHGPLAGRWLVLPLKCGP